jgi:TRAP-type C4-dicarboxylate transport system substrate-binding protein
MLRRSIPVLGLLALMAALTAVLAACSSSDAPAAAPQASQTQAAAPAAVAKPDPVVWKWITAWGKNDNSAKLAMDILMPLIAEKTDGLVTIDWEADPASVPGFEQFAPLQAGLYDGAYTAHGYHRAQQGNLLGEAVAIPLGGINEKTGECGLVEMIQKRYAKEVGMWYFPTPLGNGVSVNVVNPVKGANLEGMSLRSYPGREGFLSAVNGIAVGMPTSQAYAALDRGLIQGAIAGGGIAAPHIFSWHEILNYTIKPYLGETSTANLINLSSFNKLTDEQQGQVSEAFVEYANELRDVWIENDKTLLTKMGKDSGFSAINLEGAERAKWLDAWFVHLQKSQIDDVNARLAGETIAAINCVRAKTE